MFEKLFDFQIGKTMLPTPPVTHISTDDVQDTIASLSKLFYNFASLQR